MADDIRTGRDTRWMEAVPGHEGPRHAGPHHEGPHHEGPQGTTVPGASGPTGTGAGAQEPATGSHRSPLLPHEESEKYGLRLQHTVSGFVDTPRDAVEDADRVLQEVASRFTEAVTERRRTLRASWQTAGEGAPSTTDTEQLRLALRDYRELTERLLKL